jgi:hypothetical protein
MYRSGTLSMATSTPKKRVSRSSSPSSPEAQQFSGPMSDPVLLKSIESISAPPILAPTIFAPPMQGPMGEAPFVELVTQVSSHEFLSAWNGLIDDCLDENPFMSPMFIVPAMAHLSKDKPLALVATWQNFDGKRQLTGLFPVSSPGRQTLRGFIFGGKTELWTHSLVPFNLPLLSADPDIAEASVSAFIDWMSARRQRLSNLTLPMMLEGTQAVALFEREFARHGFDVERKRDLARTRGLNFKPSTIPTKADHVVISKGSEEVKRYLEKALCMDAHSKQASSHGLGILGDLDITLFLRAVTRGFATQEKLCLAHINQPDAQASAIIIESKSSAFLWWIMGPDSSNPMIEACLSSAVERALGKRIVAATASPVSGLWAEPISTRSFSVNVFVS